MTFPSPSSTKNEYNSQNHRGKENMSGSTMATELLNMLLTKTKRPTVSCQGWRATGARRHQEDFRRRGCSCEPRAADADHSGGLCFH